MAKPKFTPRYWSHMCSGSTGKSGMPSSEHAKLVPVQQDTKICRSALSKPELLLGLRCSRNGCAYVVDEETVLLNDLKEPIRNIGGRNLYRDRTVPTNMKCCKCGHHATTGHDPRATGFGGVNFHHCWHTQDWNFHLNWGGPPPTRWFGWSQCKCVMINRYKEPVETWQFNPRDRKPIEGGPLHLDNQYWARKEKQEAPEQGSDYV